MLRCSALRFPFSLASPRGPLSAAFGQFFHQKVSESLTLIPCTTLPPAKHGLVCLWPPCHHLYMNDVDRECAHALSSRAQTASSPETAAT